jgi:hypothetical protein
LNCLQLIFLSIRYKCLQHLTLTLKRGYHFLFQDHTVITNIVHLCLIISVVWCRMYVEIEQNIVSLARNTSDFANGLGTRCCSMQKQMPMQNLQGKSMGTFYWCMWFVYVDMIQCKFRLDQCFYLFQLQF